MQTKKMHLETFFNFTQGTDGILTLAESRIRDTFMKSLAEITNTYINDRQKIYTTFCLKNEDGTPALVDGNKFEFPTDKVEEINKELTILGEEEVEIETPQGIKEILEKSEYKPKVGEAETIDMLLSKI